MRRAAPEHESGRGKSLSDFTDSIRDSAAVSTLKECVALADAQAQEGWDDKQLNHVVTRSSVVCRDILSRLTIADKNLVPRDILDEIENQTQNIHDNLQTLVGKPPEFPFDIDSANQWLDDLLKAASPLPAVPIRSTNQVLVRAAEQFDREANEAKSSISAEVEQLRSVVTELTEQIERTASGQTDSVNELTETINSRVNEAQETLGSLEARTNEAVEKLEVDVTGIRDEFNVSQLERREEFDTALKEQERLFRERLAPVAENVEELREQAKVVLEEAAGAGTAQHYAMQRDMQQATANFWRRIGVGTLVLLFLITVIIFMDARLADMEFSVVWLAARSSVLVTLGAIATIALRQSGQHRRREEEMARVSNELLLLGPFMNRLPEQDRQALLREITPLYFKGGISAQDTGGRIGLGSRLRNALPRRGSASQEE